MDIEGYISKKIEIIDKALDKYLPPQTTKPQVIHKAMRYAVFPGGKRIRAVLAIAAFEACGGKGKAILPVACAIEFIHTYTLIHDDLPCMDNDDYRRGKLSCHKRFGEGVALLAGDALLTLSFQLLSRAGNIAIIEEISEAIGSSGTIGGQVVDIGLGKNSPGQKKRTEELDYIARHKTGALFETAVKAGGIFKGAGSKKLRSLANFGRYIGFTFQLIDDLLDEDGYARIYGDVRLRKKAELLTKKAKNCLSIFGKKSANLSGIAGLILKRCY